MDWRVLCSLTLVSMETIHHHGTRISPHNAHTSCIKDLDNMVQVHTESCVTPQMVMPPPLVGAPQKSIVTILKPAWEDEVKPTERMQGSCDQP